MIEMLELELRSSLLENSFVERRVKLGSKEETKMRKDAGATYFCRSATK